VTVCTRKIGSIENQWHSHTYSVIFAGKVTQELLPHQLCWPLFLRLRHFGLSSGVVLLCRMEDSQKSCCCVEKTGLQIWGGLGLVEYSKMSQTKPGASPTTQPNHSSFQQGDCATDRGCSFNSSNTIDYCPTCTQSPIRFQLVSCVGGEVRLEGAWDGSSSSGRWQDKEEESRQL
jgi:hypothetical protein